ncbi:DNA-binding protein ESCAROLA [Pyrus ussuriensis x Pyrus communis]|uniref:AT-hook motif nuclear-localized protein n=1 Tax=Pyrus ussuriensis x Pyrus communis TaxID=2448454 RepID=A0A5N5HT31_9ROSA|nr:DNA-binding protein ESCAROLA [Pyrus ussuriensis x Pyrus communis]
MEPNENQLSSYFQHPTTTTAPAPAAPSTAATTPSPTNGLLPNTHSTYGSHMVYSHSVPSSAVTSPLEPAKRKRGRPRKYGTPEQALAAKKAATSSSHSSSSKEKKDQHGAVSPSFSGSTKKSQQFSLGNAGQGFTPHVLTVAAGEDVGQKIMFFMQQSKREICILSASGTISNASLRQPATSGGNITYEGRFEIISLSGSYVRTDLGGRAGGLSVCLSNTDGQIIGGGVGGPLKAAGPVQVIVGTFQIDAKKDATAGVKGDASAAKLPSPGEMMSGGFRSTLDSSGRPLVRGNEDQQPMGGSHFMLQGMHVAPSRPTDWRGGPDARGTGAYELTGRGGRAPHQSPENGDYDQIQD